MSTVVVSPMRRRHLRGVVEIERQVNPNPWSMSLFAGELRMPTSRWYVVAVERHLVVGYCGLMEAAGDGHITNVAVHPEHRRRGIGVALVLATMSTAVAQGMDSATLEVRAGNRDAQELYRRFGFAPGGVRAGYYDNGREDALIMWAHDLTGDEYRRRLAATSLPDDVALVPRLRPVAVPGVPTEENV